MHLNNFSYISLASHYIFKRAAVTVCYETSFITNILNSQPILIKFALKLFVCKCLSFQTHLLLDLRFLLILISSNEQEMLKVSYWNQSLSILHRHRRASSTICFQ